jgi:hypothetical protein
LFTRRDDLTYPAKVPSPGGGGLGPLPRSNLIVKLGNRATVP